MIGGLAVSEVADLGALFKKQLRRYVEAHAQFLDVGFRKIALAVENFGNGALSAEYID